MHRTPQRTVALAATTLAAAVALGLTASPPAGAGGGDWIEPARDRYEAGQTVTMIGYGMSVPGARERGPFHAWLRVDPASVEAAAILDPELTIHPSDVRVGELVLEDVPGAVDPYRAQRASITFDLPEGLADGAYPVVLCNDPCTDAPGYFMADAIHVGIDPPYPIVRSWPLDDPAIRWLEDDALLSLRDGRQVTAAEVRAGTVNEPIAPVIPVPAAPPSTVASTGPQAAAVPDPARGGGPVGEGEAEDTVTRIADTGDGGAAAWWVAAEVAALVGGGIAAMAWVGHRRRRGGGSAPSSPRLVVRAGGTRGGPGGIADPDGSESVDGRRDSTSDRPDGAVSIRL
jgi:hypothetical protein